MSDVKSTAGLATSSITSPAIPGTPTNVSATLTAGNVRLDWTAADSLATVYNIYESTDGGSTFSYFDSVTGDPATSTAPATNYTATDLTAETTPKFYVTAQDASGESSASSHVGVAVPSPVTGVSVSLNSTDTTATIHWTAVTGAIGYYVDRIPDDGSAATLLPEVTPGTVTSEVDTGLDPTKAYSCTVNAVYPVSSAIDGSGSSGGGDGGGGDGGGGGGGGSDTDDSSDDSPTGTGTTADSDAADDASQDVGSFSAASAGAGTGAVHLTWSYQGAAKFEIEEKDTSATGTNFYCIYANDTISSIRSYDVSGLQPGVEYDFRIRAIRPDGTVSDYQDATANIPDNPPPDDDDSGIEPPSVDLSSFNTGSPEPDDYYGMVDYTTDYNIGDGYDVVQVGSSRSDDPLGIANDLYIQGFTDWDPNSQSGIWGQATPGESYKADFYTVDYDGHRSEPASVDISVPGTKPTKLSLRADKPDASGDTVFHWDAPDLSQFDSHNPDDPAPSGQVRFYLIKKVNGEETATLLSNNTDVASGSATVHLPTGADQVMAVYDIFGAYGDDSITSPYSDNINVTVTGMPAVPTMESATYDPSVKRGKVTVVWRNDSTNEDGFDIYRSDGKTFHVPADTTSFVDKSLPSNRSDWPWYYQVRAVNKIANSDYSLLATVNPIGGPDITSHLLSIEYGLENLSTSQKQWRRYRAGYYTSLSNQLGDWDIQPLWLKNAHSDHNLGVLPDGSQTVSVDGQVYLDAEVNYWLYGVWARTVGASAKWAFTKVFAHAAITTEGPFGKADWFEAGYVGDFAAAFPASIQFASALASTEGDTGPLFWQLGETPGHYNGKDNKWTLISH